MNSQKAMSIGIVLSLMYDIFQIVMSWDNEVLLFVGVCSLGVAIYGLQENLSSSEKFELNWMGLYIIPCSLIFFGEYSLIEDEYVKASQIAHINYERFLPGLSIDYFLSIKTLFFSYTLPLITLAIYLAYKLASFIFNLVKWLYKG